MRYINSFCCCRHLTHVRDAGDKSVVFAQTVIDFAEYSRSVHRAVENTERHPSREVYKRRASEAFFNVPIPGSFQPTTFNSNRTAELKCKGKGKSKSRTRSYQSSVGLGDDPGVWQ